MTGSIPLHRPWLGGRELDFVAQAHMGGLAGNGVFTRRAESWLERQTHCARAFLAHSCTAALEMSALLAGVGPGDEVILPSFTFPSTANAFVLRGVTPVFVDIRGDTHNLDENLIEPAITARTRAIVPVHYAGVACEMDVIADIARRHGLLVIEDAAQGLLASYRGAPLGSLGALGAVSFHETKNVTCGEGGALFVNDPRFVERAEILREKGTDRSRFQRGEVDRYTWRDVGSSYCPSEIEAAFLVAQLDQAHQIREWRVALWNRYHDAFAASEVAGRLRRPQVPAECGHNAHQYHVLLNDLAQREHVRRHLRENRIEASFHFVPLHSSPMGRAVGRTPAPMPHTDAAASRLLRLPLWAGLGDDLDRVIDRTLEAVAA